MFRNATPVGGAFRFERVAETTTDLAEVTGAIIVGFNVRPDPKARRSAEETGIEIRTYGIIYELLDDIEKSLAAHDGVGDRQYVATSGTGHPISSVDPDGCR